MITLTRDHARRFLVRRHLLDPPRILPENPGSVLEVRREVKAVAAALAARSGSRAGPVL